MLQYFKKRACLTQNQNPRPDTSEGGLMEDLSGTVDGEAGR